MTMLLRSTLLFAAGVCAVLASEPAAEPSPPSGARAAPTGAPAAIGAVGAYPLYGSPTAEEQYLLELINRARANPSAEGVRLETPGDADVQTAYTFYGVSLPTMKAELAALAIRPPLVFNANLLAAARGHSQWMAANNTQSHVGANSSTAGARLDAAGYAWTAYGENVFAAASNMLHAHAAFAVDWGTGGTAGMQAGRPHRAILFDSANAGHREVGLGVVAKVPPGTVAGPRVVTQNFATRAGLGPFITGVAFTDLNLDGFYTPGEGLGGLLVEVTGVSPTADPLYHAVTAGSGGWAVPVAANGTYLVRYLNTATSQVLSSTQVGVTTQTVKLDYMGPASPSAGMPPSIAAIANQTIVTGMSSSAIAVSISDPDNFAGTGLTLTGQSSNPALLPSSGFSFSGGGTARSLILTPTAGAIGTATVTLTVRDPTGMYGTRSFQVAVTSTGGATTLLSAGARRFVLGGPVPASAASVRVATSAGTQTITPSAGMWSATVPATATSVTVQMTALDGSLGPARTFTLLSAP